MRVLCGVVAMSPGSSRAGLSVLCMCTCIKLCMALELL